MQSHILLPFLSTPSTIDLIPFTKLSTSFSLVISDTTLSNSSEPTSIKQF
ncbi:hypothetical protein bpuCAU1_001547 (plasmid) [Borrelia puertoricensis]|nr:hypothetical protein [Borrelia puertoricensis]UPA19126.1 hypothetical protein bpuSUM_001674 [Borrelia puertoricensis]